MLVPLPLPFFSPSCLTSYAPATRIDSLSSASSPPSSPVLRTAAPSVSFLLSRAGFALLYCFSRTAPGLAARRVLFAMLRSRTVLHGLLRLLHLLENPAIYRFIYIHDIYIYISISHRSPSRLHHVRVRVMSSVSVTCNPVRLNLPPALRRYLTSSGFLQFRLPSSLSRIAAFRSWTDLI